MDWPIDPVNGKIVAVGAEFELITMQSEMDAIYTGNAAGKVELAVNMVGAHMVKRAPECLQK